MRHPRRSLRLRIWDILNAIEIARLSVGDLSLAQVQADPIRRFAAERAIEIISEASRHIPDDLKSKAEHLPWRQIEAIGNVLRHGYDTVNAEIIWKLAREDLIPLENFARLLMADLGSR